MRPFSMQLNYDKSQFEVDVNVIRQKNQIQYTIIPKDLELEFLFGTQVVHEVLSEGFRVGHTSQDRGYFNAIIDALINSPKRVLALARA